MAQLHFTLDYDFFAGLFSETKDEAFGKLMMNFPPSSKNCHRETLHKYDGILSPYFYKSSG